MKKWTGVCVMGATGVVLAGAVFMTRSKGVSEVNKKAYATYREECDRLDQLGFTGFAPEDTKVRFFDGDNDFVAFGTDEWKKENPVLNVMAGTTWKVGDEFQALIPVYEKMRGLTEAVAGLQMLQDGQQGTAFSENMYVATISHEVFHCWQFTGFEDQIVNGTHSYSGDMESIIAEEIDSKEELAASLEREANLFREAYYTEDVNAKKELICQAFSENAKREECLGENAQNVEYYLEALEGSARYVEAMTFCDLTSKEEFEAQYLGEFVYGGGSEKYYTIGLYKCLLLDQLDIDWQADFSFENSPSIILENVVK